jgi:uncharacterized protein involved in type VI secretion and phage assembly
METNYTFLQRLAMEYGQWLYYDGVKLNLKTPPQEKMGLRIDGVQNSFSMNVALRPIQHRVFEYNSETHQHFKADSKGKEVSGANANPYLQFAINESESLFPQASYVNGEMKIKTQSEIDDEAKLLKENAVASLVRFSGKSHDPNLKIGGIIDVKGRALGSEADQQTDFGVYRIINLTHHIDAMQRYSNSFEAVPHTLETPPVNPNVRSAFGQPELAIVTNNQDEKKLGRVKVEFFWPNDDKKEKESCWMRVSTPYSGNGKGVLTVPEVGDQVLVGYHRNLAERPVVLGSLQHKKGGKNYTFANNHIKGISTKGGQKVTVNEKANTVTISNSNSKGDFITVDFANNTVNITSGAKITLNSNTIDMNAATINMNAGDINVMASQNEEGGGGNIKISAQTKMDIENTPELNNSAEKITTSAAGTIYMTSPDTQIF